MTPGTVVVITPAETHRPGLAGRLPEADDLGRIHVAVRSVENPLIGTARELNIASVGTKVRLEPFELLVVTPAPSTRIFIIEHFLG